MKTIIFYYTQVHNANGNTSENWKIW